MAAAVAFLGSLVMLDAGRTVVHFGTGARAEGPPGVLLVAMVVVLGTTGALLLALAGKELLGEHRLHPARGALRRRR
jgi:hypothetical protein